jgi:geranyl-CoA carboxylase alpha subunit
VKFDSVLIANRGEIAVRVIRTARDLGYRTIAVYSDADADAPHVELADEAVRLGPSEASKSYLNVEAILAAAQRTAAGAIHPGYGFLSENADFAERCAQAGLVFIGPPPAAIRVMGDKVKAKLAMIEAGVPTAAGYLGSDQSDERLRSEAEEMGVPLLVKAVAGGGGRGMRKVTDLAELPEALAGARSEALNAFGNGDLFLERLVTGARHVEVQVFADEHGDVVHLAERECSVQRRHQKIVEEAPSPVVHWDLRKRMGTAAVAAARAIDYRGAGTVEFLVDDDGDFYFLEMNTRLQVEHPVTELVTGVDLVAWQLAVAQGEPLPLSQEHIHIEGHAIEARLYAEDPAQGFLPQLGSIHRFTAPSGPRIRVDAGVRTGGEVSSFYDPMVAKIIGYGPDRNAAIQALVGALRRTTLLGLTTNRDFLLALVGSELFAGGQFRTDTLDAGGVEPYVHDEGIPEEAWALAAALVAHGRADGWRSTGLASWPVTLRHGSDERSFEVTHGARELSVRPSEGDGAWTIRVLSRDADGARVDVDGVLRTVQWAQAGDTLYIDDRGLIAAFVEPSVAAELEGGPSDGSVEAPIGGKVLAVDVEDGATVQEGQRLLSVEAMKIEHRVVAPRAGVVTGLNVGPGDQVAALQRLCTIESPQEES